MKAILIRKPSESLIQAVEEIQKQTSIKTNTGAVVFAVKRYASIRSDFSTMADNYYKLRAEVDRLLILLSQQDSLIADKAVIIDNLKTIQKNGK